jgi:predicted CoA-binding protein
MSGECEFPKINLSNKEIATLLKDVKTIAVVGLSHKPDRPSHWIAAYLRDHGYRVIGVNPSQTEVFGEKVYASLSDIPEKIDLANLFLRPESVPPVVDEAIAKGVKAVWMQEGIVNNAAADKARAAGLSVVMNKCIYKEHAARA